jgi:pimeloyl-ACP methyl ester carboxylesterase
MHLLEWVPEAGSEKEPSIVMVHGLASNARTWDAVGRLLASSGHRAVAIDQRGHGRSQKPANGYDFATLTEDLRRLLDELGWGQPVLAGQSLGGNVLLEFAARYPVVAGKLIFVDGGYLDLKARGPWEQVAVDLRPPNLLGTPRAWIADQIRRGNPGWSDAAVEATLDNFEALADGTVRPWLSLERHMRILRALFNQEPAALYPRVEEPVLICVADDGSEWAQEKRGQVQRALEGLRDAEVAWFRDAAHDIHVDQPAALADRILEFIAR